MGPELQAAESNRDPCNLTPVNLIVFPVEYKFHETSHLSARAAERGFSVEQAMETVKTPSSVVKNPRNKGNHGGLIRLFFRSYGRKFWLLSRR